MPRFQHFVITRFSIRPTMTSTDRLSLIRSVGRTDHFDPLTPSFLEHRFRVFEMACLPGVLAQTTQNFTWLIVVDRDLSAEARAQLARLIGDRPRTVIHDYDPTQTLGDVAWLEPYLDTPAPDYLLTTNLDDDDALPPRFAESLHAIIEERGDRVAPLEVFGATRLWEWDLEVTDDAPLGYRAAWHRDFISVVSVGFSLLVRYPDYPLTVMGVSHPIGSVLLDWGTAYPQPLLNEMRATIQAYADRVGDSLRDFDPAETFHDWVEQAGMPTMTNHQINVQTTRLYESKERTAVTGPETFPNAVIDWDAARRYARHFRASRRARLEYRLLPARRFSRRAIARLRRAPARLRRMLSGG